MDLLKGKVTPWQQMVNRWRAARNVPFRKKFFVGYDLDGNTFWEFQNYNNPARMRRIVEYRDPKGNYVDYKIPPQWVQWLRHNRPSQPSLEELYNDKMRQDNLKGLIREADQRWASVPLKAEYRSRPDAEAGKIQGVKESKAPSTSRTEPQFQPEEWSPQPKR